MTPTPTPTPARPALDASRLADKLALLREMAHGYSFTSAADPLSSYLVALAENSEAIISSLRSLADMRGELEKAQAAVVDYNANLRSAFQIAHRAGDQTNWRAFREQVNDTLDKHHKTFIAAESALARCAP